MRTLLLFHFLVCAYILSYGQQTVVSGVVKDAETGEVFPGVIVRFADSKIGAVTDSVGHYSIATYYASDSLVFYAPEYKIIKKHVTLDQTQVIDVTMVIASKEMNEVEISAPEELLSTRIIKRVIANKPINNKEKLDSYGYELYNKIQIDLNNIGDKFTERGLVKRLDVVMDYLDSSDNDKSYLPVILSENISDFYYQNKPHKKKETVSATRISGIENIQLNQFLGEMYLDFNVYDNYLNLFQKAFVSPVANFARSYYKYVLVDSAFVDNDWCYLISFKPKRTGDMTFEGEMWIHDTTYAIKQIKANISPWANINYVQDLYLEHHFDQVEKEVWMLTEEKMIIDLKITKGTELYGFYGRKYSSRKDFQINQKYNDDFFKSENTVSFEEGAKNRDEAYWAAHRHVPLNKQEQGIDQMVDSLNKDPFFSFLKNFTYMVSSGYYPIGKLEIGSVHTLVAFNPVENFRTGVALRTSNAFSRKIELGGRLYYGFGDERFKYAATLRLNLSPKKRTLLNGYYVYDIEQLGLSPTAASIGSTFGSIFRTGPLDKLTMVGKGGITLERDLHKDFILYTGLEWKEFTALGLANYERLNSEGNVENIKRIQTAEATVRLRYCKDEEFLSGAFDRAPLPSPHPIFSIQGIFGIKGVFGSDYDYQKIEFSMEHYRNIGVLGRLRYGVSAGYINGIAAYPFLKVHEGSQSYWLYTNSFNRMAYFEFISDEYVGAFVEQHWQGLFFDRIPLVKKLKWRLVTTGRVAYGSLSDRHSSAMIIPDFVRRFGHTPYVEASVGIENIFKVGRVDVVWRLTHLYEGISPIGIRARWSLNF